MIREFMSSVPLYGLPLLSLFLFATFFISVILMVIKKGSAGYSAVQALPLKDDEVSR